VRRCRREPDSISHFAGPAVEAAAYSVGDGNLYKARGLPTLLRGADDLLIANSEPGVISANLGPAFSPAFQRVANGIRNSNVAPSLQYQKSSLLLPCNRKKCSLLLKVGRFFPTY
jgi:hypothetical protein